MIDLKVNYLDELELAKQSRWPTFRNGGTAE